MIEGMIRLSVANKLVVALLVIGLVFAGVYNLGQLPIDAVPDITNNQVQVVTVSGSLAPQEVEQFITYPVEIAVANIPNVTEIRSISRYGLSVVTIVFKDHVPILEARQFVKEQISLAAGEIPAGMGVPELMPITTGLGEIYQYVLQVMPGYEDRYDAMELRTIQDWIVKRQLAGTPGIIEISSFGGLLKQYEVALDPMLLQSMDVTVAEVFDALAKNNQNTGGSYIEKQTNAYYIRTEGLVRSIEDIEQIPITTHQGVPVLIHHVGKVRFGSPKRFGAMTMDGKGEAVGGITLMLKGGNSSEAIKNVHERIALVEKSLPEGVALYPYLDRSVLVGKAIDTVKKNLLEGGLIVVFVLVLLLGDLRAGLIVASVIPLAMLFTIILMNYFGVSANLMSLGAIDFGIVVDGAVIVVEGVMHGLFTYYVGRTLSQAEMDDMIVTSSAKLFRSAVFGVFIILVVFVPIMTLTGIEGKMFRPMAMTFSFAVSGALLLSLTYVPAVSALVLPKTIKSHTSFADKIVGVLRKIYQPSLELALRRPGWILGSALVVLIGATLLFRTLGAVFIPTLEEGDLAMQMAVQPGSSLQESVKTSTKAEKILLDNFPEIKHVVSKIGTAEVPTDPMAIEDADIMIILKEKHEWTSATTREELVEKMKEKLSDIAGASFEFTQPIQLRFNELMTGAKTDIAVKIFGEDTEMLKELADKAASLIVNISGAADVKVEQTDGLPQLMVQFNRSKIAQYGLNIEDVNTLVRTAFAGETAGVVFENERKFDLVVRLNTAARDAFDLDELFVHLPDNASIPLSELASVQYTEGPMQISREAAQRRINVGINVRNRDIASLVADIEQTLQAQLHLPAGYSIRYGGEFENLQKASQRLAIAVPVALLLIFALLYFTFGKVKYALMIFTAVPLSAIGGVLALWLRGMPFSISAGVGFIALFGVAVLNGIVLISHFNRMRMEDGYTDIRQVVVEGSLTRLRPVVMTATVAALGFLPMALSSSNGAEVQRPLATVVIGGLITATLLTLILLPVLYYLTNKKLSKPAASVATCLLIGLSFTYSPSQAQTPVLTMEAAVANVRANHPAWQQAERYEQLATIGMQAAVERPPLDINLQGGQINSPLFDYNLSIVQGLGNRAANHARKDWYASLKNLSSAQKIRLQHQLIYQVQQDWLSWYYAVRQAAPLATQASQYQQALDRAKVQWQAGEIDRLAYDLVASRLTQVQNQWALAQQQVVDAARALSQSAWLEGAFTIPDEVPDIAWNMATTPLPLLTTENEQARRVAEGEVALAQAALKPTFSVGYFLQSIRPDYTFQGGLLGVSIPVFQQAQKAQIEQAEHKVLIASRQLQWQEQAVSKEYQFARSQWETLLNQWEQQYPALVAQAASIRMVAMQQLQQGEVDYFHYLVAMDTALQNELAAIDLAHRYQQALLRVTYFSTNFNNN
ncbi:MAG: CusA/CzcA family heavy metal efflux RND transporter [Saprospiraceae bacterium]